MIGPPTSGKAPPGFAAMRKGTKAKPIHAFEGPYDPPLDGTMSLHDLWWWVVTKGRTLSNREIAIRAAERHGVKAASRTKLRDRGLKLAIDETDEAIRQAHIHGRIRLWGIKPGKSGPPKIIPPGGLRGASFEVLGGQPITDREKHGGREYGQIGQMRPGGFVIDITWEAVCVDKADVRRAFPYRKPSASTPSKLTKPPKLTKPLPVIGRKEINDTESLQQMRRLLESREARSISDAARAVATAGGLEGNSLASTIARLKKKYSRAFPTD